MIQNLTEFLKTSPTGYHARDNAKDLLVKNGFTPLPANEDWQLFEGGKYFTTRGASLIAFTVGALNDFSYKIAAAHVDSPALKLKYSPITKSAGVYASLNVETYGGGIWHTFLDRPLKIAGQVVCEEEGRVYPQTVEAPFLVHIPSVAIHQNRGVNDGFAINPQVDLLPLLSLNGELTEADFLQAITNEENVLSYDLYAVNADMPYSFGVNGEFLASPRIDNLTGVYSILEALLSHAESGGVCVAALFTHEEIGSHSSQGADGDFLQNTLRRIAYALRFDDNEYYKALASSFLMSVDNGHGLHPNHPEKTDVTNKPVLGKGVIVKTHASGAYLTDGLSAGIVGKIFDKAGVKRQNFFNRSDMRSGSTLGVPAASALGIGGADIGLAQLAMHSACECFAKDDYIELVNGLTAFYSTDILADCDGYSVK